MTDWGISQLPILDTQGRIKGVVSETSILHALHSGKSKMTDEIELLADSQYELVTPSTTIEAVSRVIAQGKLALVQDLQQQKLLTVLTKIDLLNFLGSKF
jgi:predicted transcriptional regulator